MTKLQKVREKNNLNKWQLHCKCGISRIVLDHLERKESSLGQINVKTLFALCDALNCKVSDIAEEDEKDNLYQLILNCEQRK